MRFNISLEQSLEKCPPTSSIVEEGITWVDRKIVSLDKIQFLKKDQPRETNISPDHVDDLKLSYRNNGFIHNREPQAIIVDPEMPNAFLGRKGFNRHKAQLQLGVTHMIYDVISFDTLYEDYVFRFESNEKDEHTIPAKENEVSTIIKGIIDGIDQGIIVFKEGDKEDYKRAIYDFLGRAYKKHKHLWDKVYKSVRNLKGPYKGMVAYNRKGANDKAQELNLPFGVDTNRYLYQHRLGYISKNKPGKSIIHDTKTLVIDKKYSGQNVYLTQYIDNPNPKNVSESRNLKEEELDQVKSKELKWLKYLLGDNLVEVINDKIGVGRIEEAFEKNYPIVHNGFLPQHYGENSLVDKNGNIMESKI